jgi:HEAT repeat protein
MFGARPLPRSLEAALRDLGADKPAVRAASVRDLSAHGADVDDGGDASGDATASPARERIVRALLRTLRNDAAPEVRAVAATALADLHAIEGLSELLLAVEDDDALVRQMAICALGELGDSRATERLRRALGDERAEVRFQAVMAYPRVCASREASLDALLAATSDPDALVCHIALRMTDEVRGEGAPDPRVLERARALLDHASSQVRVVCAVLLATEHARAQADDRADDRADPRIAAILTKLARGDEKTTDPEDLAAGIELCGELGLTDATRGLERRAFGGLLGLRRDPHAWHARVALARMGHERARREILRELGAADRDVRSLAVAAAGRARIEAAREPILRMRGDERRVDPHAVDEALAALGDPSTDAHADVGGAGDAGAGLASHA